MGNCIMLDGNILFSRLSVHTLREMVSNCHADMDRISVLYDNEIYTAYDFIRALRAIA